MKHLTAYRMLINSLLSMHTMCYKDVNQQSTWHAHYVLHEANIISIVNVMSIPIYKANGKHTTEMFLRHFPQLVVRMLFIFFDVMLYHI